ncbi:MAG: hypothetical protein ACT4PQ_11200 [Betaproteobacteria bacterium]
MTTHWKRLLVSLAAAVWVCAHAGTALAQQTQPRKPAVQQPQAQQSGRAYYEMYEPSQRQRLRRESCGRNEVPIGASCVRTCKQGYLQVAGSKPPRCRSIAPLPAGQLPGPVHKEASTPPPRPPRKPAPPQQPATGPRPA